MIFIYNDRSIIGSIGDIFFNSIKSFLENSFLKFGVDDRSNIIFCLFFVFGFCFLRESLV